MPSRVPITRSAVRCAVLLTLPHAARCKLQVVCAAVQRSRSDFRDALIALSMAHARTVGQQWGRHTHLIYACHKCGETRPRPRPWWTSWVLAMAHKQLQMSNSSGLERLSSAAWQIFYVNAANDAVIFPRMPTFIYLSLSFSLLCLPFLSFLSLSTLLALFCSCNHAKENVACIDYSRQQGQNHRKRERERSRDCVREREKDRRGHTLGDTHSRSWLQQQQLVSSQIR